MSITITGPSEQFRHDVPKSIIEAVGRAIKLVYVDHIGPCIVCSGTNPFCGTCFGNPSVEYEEEISLTATVRWGPSEKKIYTPNGQYVEGDCKVVYSVDDFTENDHLLQKVRRVVVDSRSCVLDKWYYKGEPINRCYLILNEDDMLTGTRIG